MPIKIVMLVAEDDLSMAVVQRLVKECNPSLCVRLSIVSRGFGNIKNNLLKYIQASQVIPHIILTDLDQHQCPSALFQDWGIKQLPATCVFRIAVKEIEAWLLADRVGFAEFLKVAINGIPAYPEQEADPKSTLLNLAKKSRRKGIARDLLPTEFSGATIGPLYNPVLSQYVETNWNIVRASENSESLQRAITRISEL